MSDNSLKKEIIDDFFSDHPGVFPDLWRSVIMGSLEKYETTDYEFSMIDEILNAELLKVENNA